MTAVDYPDRTAKPITPPPTSTPLVPVPSAGAGVASPGAGTAEQNDAFAYIGNQLDQYDLGGLSNWAWDQIVNGHSAEQVMQSMRQQQTYIDRFKGMAIRQANGLPAISEGEYISYERQAMQLMRAAGFPPEFWDSPDDYANLIGNDVSVNELNQRVTSAYTRVAQAPTEVRSAFDNFFGTDGDTAFAAYFLDPDRAAPLLEKAVTQAEIAGTGARFGIGISQGTSSRLADLGVNLNMAQQGFQQLAGQSALYRESVTEAQDLRMGVEGVAATFGDSPEDAAAVQARKDARQAAFSGTSNTTSTGQTGAIGLGGTHDF